jgi:hypothetical protein
LNIEQVQRMNSAEQTLSDRLRQHFDLSPEDVFLQGSYANNSAIKPPPRSDDGEYDVDLVCVCAQHGQAPAEALHTLTGALHAVGYGERIEQDPQRKRPCVRLRYADDAAGRFHVDVTPAREMDGEAPLEIPRPANPSWRPTAPQEYAEWCNNRGAEFLRTVQELKRWRDENQSARQAIKSIVLQVLIAVHMPRGMGDGERIARTLREIAQLLAAHPTSPPVVWNPVLASENLAETWPPDAYANFIKVSEDAAKLAERALGETAESESRRLWRELLGSDFPDEPGSGGTTPPRPAPSARKARQGAPRNEWA